MELLEKSGNQLTIIAEIEDSLANAIRRYVGEIPILAIEELDIAKNDSPLYDETLAHRFGLVPIKSDKVKEKEEISAKIISKKEGMVYSGEIEGPVEMVYDNIPLTVLTKGQELQASILIRAGKGNEHAKFNPGLIFYRNVSEISLDSSLKEKAKEKINGNEIKEKGGKVIVVDNRKKEVSGICENLSKEAGKKIEIEFKDELILTVESFGQISADKIFVKSIEVLQKDLENFSKLVDKS